MQEQLSQLPSQVSTVLGEAPANHYNPPGANRRGLGGAGTYLRITGPFTSLLGPERTKGRQPPDTRWLTAHGEELGEGKGLAQSHTAQRPQPDLYGCANLRVPSVLGCTGHCWGPDVQSPELTPGNKATRANGPPAISSQPTGLLISSQGSAEHYKVLETPRAV